MKARSIKDWIVLALATGLFVGMIPPRVATLATLWGIPLTCLLHSAFGYSPAYLLILVALWLAGVWICNRGAEILEKHDPREITYDEWTTLPLVYFHAASLDGWTLMVGFLLHRLFDIAKPLFINRLQRLPGGWGIMADDIAAAFCALLVMRAVSYWGFL